MFFRFEQEGGRGSAAGAVAVVRPDVVEEAQETIRRALELGEAREVAAADLHAPVLVEDGAVDLIPRNPSVSAWGNPDFVFLYPQGEQVRSLLDFLEGGTRSEVKPSFGLSLRSFHYLQQFR